MKYLLLLLLVGCNMFKNDSEHDPCQSYDVGWALATKESAEDEYEFELIKDHNKCMDALAESEVEYKRCIFLETDVSCN